MAWRTISDCKGCGMTPCYNCKATVAVCDVCGEEVEEIFDAPFTQIDGYACCNCLSDYIRNHPIEIVRLLWEEEIIEKCRP